MTGSTATSDARLFGAARLWAVTKQPYLATALFACTPVVARGTGTIAVDQRWRVHADPVAMARFDAPALGRLLIHLVSHLVRDHAARAEALQVAARRQWWGRCGDAEINDDLRACDCLPPVANELPRDLGQRDGGLAETYFAHSPAAGGDAGNWDCGSGADGSPRPWEDDGSANGQPGVTSGQADLLRLSIADDIQQRAHREPGSVPAGWVRWAAAIRPSRTDWRRVLGAEIRRAVTKVSGNLDYSYQRPSRRQQIDPTRQRVVFPSLVRPVPNVAIVCDTSGSMHEGLLERVLAEVEGLLARAGLRSRGATTLAVDAEVQDVQRVGRAAQVRLTGGGGTDMGAGIAAALLVRPRPDVIVVLTDGYTPWPDHAPSNVRVVVGLLAEGGDHGEGPGWARTVVVDEDE